VSVDAIAVVCGDPKLRRGLVRILSATFHPVSAHTSLKALLAEGPAPARLCVMSHDDFLSGDGQELAAHWGAAGGECVVLLPTGAEADVPRLFATQTLSHLLGNQQPLLAEDLLATATKVLRRDYFGMEKYLSWGAEIRELELERAEERTDAVERVTADVQAAGLGSRVGWLVSMVTDELLSNALYDAPVDADGQHHRRTEDRDATRDLDARERVTLRYAFDARYLAIEVTDQFGSLPRATTLAHLAKCTVPRAPNKTSMLEGGAGLGTGLVYGCCSHLVYNVAPGARTQAISLFDVRLQRSDVDRPATSFDFFYVEEPRDDR
jgi:hypothetical protein